MPKAKPNQVIVHRIELQQTEREALEAALAGRFVTNAVQATGSVLTGMGAVLAPFSGAFAAIAGLWIAEKGATALIDAAENTVDQAQKISDFLNPSKQQDAYQYICSYLTACSGWDGDENSVVKRLPHLYKDLQKMNAHPILLIKLQHFGKKVKGEFIQNGTWPPKEPVYAWKAFYPPTAYLNDLKQQLKENIPGI
jgi:hypothetical protein